MSISVLYSEGECYLIERSIITAKDKFVNSIYTNILQLDTKYINVSNVKSSTNEY